MGENELEERKKVSAVEVVEIADNLPKYNSCLQFP